MVKEARRRIVSERCALFLVVLYAPSCPGCAGSKCGPVLREGYHFYIFVISYMFMLYSCMPGLNVLYK